MSRAAQHLPAGALPPGLSAGGAAAFDKSLLLAEHVDRFRARTLVETGLYQGGGSGMKIADRVRYLAVDWQAENVARAREEGHEAYCGDSPAVLETLLGGLEPPVVFWLDAHSLDEAEGSPQVCPVLGELSVIAGWEHAGESVVLIDDLWGFGQLRGWPTLDELREHADRPGLWNRDEAGGVMRLEPRR